MTDDSKPSYSSDVDEFRRVLSASHNIVVITGAGLSAASGIPTFRTGNGLWQTHDVASLATPDAFASNPVLVWQFYHERRRTVLTASPNPAHYALAVLSLPSYLQTVAPSCAQFTIVTQNVDGLSTRAYKEVVSRHSNGTPDPVLYPPNLFEMHGRLLDTLCTGCGHRERNDADPLCAALGRAMKPEEMEGISVEDLPHCLRCGGLLRPGVVWFEEIPHHLREIRQVVESTDLCLVIGTSSTVYPAAGYAHDVAERGGTVAVFNIERPQEDEVADFFFQGPCEQTLPAILLGCDST
ncbi:DHS-like NAD/FAD-binding domain-containing protein [Phlebopus sp. FC_14]|nr:DHS-like NAD/FAD-binding domain-containing protein [Phlebopus sp. FC_14]